MDYLSEMLRTHVRCYLCMDMRRPVHRREMRWLRVESVDAGGLMVGLAWRPGLDGSNGCSNVRCGHHSTGGVVEGGGWWPLQCTLCCAACHDVCFCGSDLAAVKPSVGLAFIWLEFH